VPNHVNQSHLPFPTGTGNFLERGTSKPQKAPFFPLKIHLHTGFLGPIYVASSCGNWEAGSEKLRTRRSKAKLERVPGRYRSGQTGQTVNLLAYAFSGSNPLLPIPLNENDLDQCQQQKFQVVIFDLVALKLEFTPLEDAYFL
jgi:hypothetical protein